MGSVEHSQPDGAVVGLVEVPAGPGQVEAVGDQYLRAVATDRAGRIAAQGETVFDRAVGVAEELDRVDADQAGVSRSSASRRGAACRRDGVDAGLATGGQDVGDLFAGTGPVGDRGGGAVPQVVRVSDDREGTLPVFGQRSEMGRWHDAFRGVRCRGTSFTFPMNHPG